MGDGFNALGREVAIAQPAVVLVAGVDDPLDGLAGKVIASGTAQQIKDNPDVKRAYLGDDAV
jgi:ABC-type branched-subunit amino acid transport system ATPase component